MTHDSSVDDGKEDDRDNPSRSVANASGREGAMGGSVVASGFMSALRRFKFSGSTALYSSTSGPGGGEEDDVSRRRRGRGGGGGGGVFFALRPKRSLNQLVIANDYHVADDHRRSSGAGRPSSLLSSATPTATIVGGGMGGGGGRGCLYDARMAALRNVVYHRAWKLIILACIILLLVGPSVHTIWMPKSSDMGVLIVLICSIAILVVDLIIRCIVDESYFLLRDRESLRAAKCGRMTRLLHVGSFAFWFDLVRTTFKVIHLPLDSFQFFSLTMHARSIPYRLPSPRSY
jgi:hypothetical protein